MTSETITRRYTLIGHTPEGEEVYRVDVGIDCAGLPGAVIPDVLRIVWDPSNCLMWIATRKAVGLGALMSAAAEFRRMMMTEDDDDLD